MKISKPLAALVLGGILSIGAVSAQASTTLYSTSNLMAGFLGEPGSVDASFSAASAGLGYLNFQLGGLATLDGYGNCCTDVFTLTVNGAKVFEGTFNMGGGGSNAILFNPDGATALTTTYGATDDLHNSTQITWNGGVTDIALPVSLQAGSNTISFAYSGALQGIGDEGWKVNAVAVTAVPEASTYAMMLSGLGLIGVCMGRRKRM